MGNTCCNDDSVQSTEILPPAAPPSSNKVVQSQKQVSYIDSEGNPMPNAYKRYVKPPTTVGRQSIIVKNLHQHDQVPDWIWAFDKNILSSNHNKGISKNPQNFEHRKTFQEIQGRFKGLQTVNLSKLNLQPRNMSGSYTTGINNGVGVPINQNKMRYTVQTGPFQPGLLQSGKPVMPNQPNNQVINTSQQLKKTFSVQEVPIITSVNASQNIVQHNPISSNMASVNHSVQQSPARPMSVIKY